MIGILTSILLCLILLEKNASLEELKKEITIYPQVLVNARVDNDKKNRYKEDNEICVAIEALEKEFAGNGRVLIRPSGTENLIRVMIEGEDLDYIKLKAHEVASLIENKLG